VGFYRPQLPVVEREQKNAPPSRDEHLRDLAVTSQTRVEHVAVLCDVARRRFPATLDRPSRVPKAAIAHGPDDRVRPGERMPTQRVFISGVAGFLDSHLADAMLADSWEIVNVDNLIGGYLNNVPAGVSFHRADCNDLATIRTLMAGA